MIGASFLIGIVSNFVNSWIDSGKQRADLKTQMELKQKELLIEIERAKAVKEFDLKIEEEKTKQLEIDILKEELKFISTQTQEIYKTDREVVNKASQWVVNLIALEKPVAVFVVLIAFFVVCICTAFNVISKENVEALNQVHFFFVVEVVMGFLFGGVVKNNKSHIGKK